jgi:hypothetical protein
VPNPNFSRPITYRGKGNILLLARKC